MAIPLIIIINVNTHIFNWWFLAFFVLILLLDIFFEIQKEKIMDPKAFLDMDLLKAKEKILRYKRLLNKENLVKISFLNVMAVCIILLVFNRASSPYVTVLTVVYIIVVFTYYIFKHKKTIKELDNLANQIKSLKQA
jgi:protein-S-isoprenylcysteine O-methyltransferase Ste14